MDRLYPPLTVADAAGDEEDVRDPILERGMEVADELTDKANLLGRRRVDKETHTKRDLSRGEVG